MLLQLFVCPCFYEVLSVLSSFSIVLLGKRELFALLKLSSCLVFVCVLLLFLTVPCVGVQCAIVVFPDRTHSLFMHARSGVSGVPAARKYRFVSFVINTKYGHACADAESSVGACQTLTTFFFYFLVDEGREDPNTTKSWQSSPAILSPPAKRHLNGVSLAD